jgi:hypothetical protein
MQYEELQAIWATQNQRPIFAVNDFSLHMELNRTRAKARRRHFWVDIFPLYIIAPVFFVLLALPCLKFFLQGPPNVLGPGELPLTIWDLVACLVGIALFLYALWSMETNRRRNEERQKVFAPSLREEIELGIAQVDFDMSRVANDREWRVGTACILSAVILAWELARLNDNPLPWTILWMAGPWLFLSFFIRPLWKRQAMERVQKRRQALEALRAKLDENPAGKCWSG